MSKTGYVINLALRDPTDVDKCCTERSQARGNGIHLLLWTSFHMGFFGPSPALRWTNNPSA